MKYRLIMLGLIVILALSMGACQSGTTGDSTEPEKPKSSTDSYAAATSVKYYTCRVLEETPNLEDDISFTANKGVTVILCSNQTTGFQWNEEADISDTSIVEQTSHTYTAPTSDKVGASGMEKFVFMGVSPGAATVKLEYSQPWDGGEKAVWTVTLNITIK
ncbi:MAG: protease inhibitor I42 family protein [Dehalococcoidales bacterium]|nr:protease inhibitor I42 family protein [Dehalococcoidales bacterium]